MKKILIIGFTLTAIIVTGLFLKIRQVDRKEIVATDRAAVDSADYQTTTLTTDYFAIFNDSPKKMSRITTVYAQPWIYSGGFTRPRLATDNVEIGSTTGLPFKFYVTGTSGFSDDITLTGGKKLKWGSGAYVTTSTVDSDIEFYSPVAGTISLEELVTGNGAVDLSIIPNNSVVVEAGDTAYGDADFRFFGNTLYLTGNTSDTAMSILTLTANVGLRVLNSGDGDGISLRSYGGGDGLVIDNAASGGANSRGIYIANSQPATGLSINNSSSGYAQYLVNTSTGTGIHISNTGTGNAIRTTTPAIGDVFTVRDSVYFDYLNGAATGSRFGVFTNSGAMDSGTLNPVWRGLVDPMLDVITHLNDRKNKEIKFFHIDDKTKEVVSTYGLPNGMDAFEALQYNDEQFFRIIANRDSIIANLTKRVDALEQSPKQKLNEKMRDVDKIYLGLIVFLAILCLVVAIWKQK